MAYVDPASNHGSKPQRLSDKNCKSCTMKQNTFGGISSKLFTKNSIYTQKTIFNATFTRKITEPLRKIKIRIYDL